MLDIKGIERQSETEVKRFKIVNIKQRGKRRGIALNENQNRKTHYKNY